LSTFADRQRPLPRRDVDQASFVQPNLKGVSVTMLWALHNRASEARRDDGVLVDPDCVRIHASIDYDFAQHFGDPLGSLAARAAEIDRVLTRWLQLYPNGSIVSLGEGLETQALRVDNGRMQWLSVDLPDAIRMRAKFLPPTARFRHIAASALDPTWMDAVDPASGVFVIAQGLLMYLDAAPVRQLVTAVAERFPGVEMVFDTVPRWFSQLTMAGLNQTPHYRLPPMPWGIDRDEIEPTLRAWHSGITDVALLSHRIPRGLPRLLADIVTHIPMARHAVPSLVHVRTANRAWSASNPKENRSLYKTTPPCRISTMTDHSDTISHADAMDCVVSAARENAARGNDIVIATSQVIAKRVALGIAAAFDPMNADHVEFARIVPEKVKAFSTSGMDMLRHSSEANRQMLRFASDEVTMTVRATMEIAECASPAAFAEAQGRFALACFSRAASSFIKLGMLALTAQAAAMAPIHATVVANAERLGR
jgi:O-methyltransferase involved in polyketide biosynthesis